MSAKEMVTRRTTVSVVVRLELRLTSIDDVRLYMLNASRSIPLPLSLMFSMLNLSRI
jgi:hypothetical protein